MPVQPPTLTPAVTRRTTLGLAAGGLLATSACGTDPGSAPADDPDTDLVDEVVAAITEVAAVAAGVPRLLTMHTAHLAALEADAPAATTSTAGGPQVRSAERTHQRYLVDAAMRAESGPLARLLASMSAAVAQQLAVPGRLS